MLDPSLQPVVTGIRKIEQYLLQFNVKICATYSTVIKTQHMNHNLYSDQHNAYHDQHNHNSIP